MQEPIFQQAEEIFNIEVNLMQTICLLFIIHHERGSNEQWLKRNNHVFCVLSQFKEPPEINTQ